MKLQPHPEYAALLRRINLIQHHACAINLHLFRMVKPRYCSDKDIINGMGGKKSSGRWNIRGDFHCTYASKAAETALKESLSSIRKKNLPDEKALPRTLVCIRLKASKALDLTDGTIRQHLRVSHKRMINTDQWTTDNYNDQQSLTQALGRAAFQVGFEAIIVPSAADSTGTNLVIFPDNLLRSSQLEVVTPVK